MRNINNEYHHFMLGTYLLHPLSSVSTRPRACMMMRVAMRAWLWSHAHDDAYAAISHTHDLVVCVNAPIDSRIECAGRASCGHCIVSLRTHRSHHHHSCHFRDHSLDQPSTMDDITRLQPPHATAHFVSLRWRVQHHCCL